MPLNAYQSEYTVGTRLPHARRYDLIFDPLFKCGIRHHCHKSSNEQGNQHMVASLPLMVASSPSFDLSSANL